jgi:hypothetical protein
VVATTVVPRLVAFTRTSDEGDSATAATHADQVDGSRTGSATRCVSGEASRVITVGKATPGDTPSRSLVFLAISSVEDWRAKTELAKDAATVAYLEGTRGSEDIGQRRFAAAKTDRIYGWGHLASRCRTNEAPPVWPPYGRLTPLGAYLRPDRRVGSSGIRTLAELRISGQREAQRQTRPGGTPHRSANAEVWVNAGARCRS